MYNTSDIINSQVTVAGNTYIPAGIHDNLEMTGIRNEISVNGHPFVEFAFTNANGDLFKHTEFEASKSSNDTDITFAEKQSKQAARILQILEAYISDKESLKFSAPDFKSFVKLAITILGDKYKGTKVRCKLVYNDKGFTTFPRYSKYTFIENMDVEKSNIRPLSIDVFTRPQLATDNAKNNEENPFSTIKNDKSTDDLPF